MYFARPASTTDAQPKSTSFFCRVDTKEEYETSCRAIFFLAYSLTYVPNIVPTYT